MLMRDPHVDKLFYKLKHDKSVEYNNPPAVEGKQKDYRYKLSQGTLQIEMLSHCSSVEDARNLVKPFLKAWEANILLKSGKNLLWFEFEDSEIIDRDPPSPGKAIRDCVTITSRFEMTFVVVEREYPTPPKYLLSANADTLVNRYQGYLDGKEKLLPMAYFCLTVIEQEGEKRDTEKRNKRKKASNYYKIDVNILNKLAELSSVKGDENTARKRDSDSQYQALTSKEEKWINEALRKIILQVTAVDDDKQPAFLSMWDLAVQL
jgi:uncharacterized tellurite resistance protein B-like protein